MKKGTVVINNDLLTEDQEGRCRFTNEHECGHWMLSYKTKE